MSTDTRPTAARSTRRAIWISLVLIATAVALASAAGWFGDARVASGNPARR